MFRTLAGPLAVNSLGARNNDLPNRQGFLADHFKHLRSTKRIHMHKFCDLRHVTPVGSLVKNDIDLVERGGDRVAITQIAVNEFRLLVDPRWYSAAMSLWFQIVERPNLPAIVHEQIHHMPVTSIGGFKRIAELAGGARFPAKLLRALQRCQGDPEMVKRVGLHFAIEQCHDLLDNDVAGIHFYTLNRSDATRVIFDSLGIPRRRNPEPSSV